MSQQSRTPWQTMPKEEPPAGYRPLLQQPYGRAPYPRQPGTGKKRLPPIAWIGIGIGILIVLVTSSNSANKSGDATISATPFSTATAAPTPSSRSIVVIGTAPRATTPLSSALPTTKVATATSAAPPPAPAAAQVVTVKESPVNVRQSADPNAPVIATLDPATDATIIGPDTTGPDGATRWVHVRAGNTTGYVRSDLVGAPHAAGA